MTEQNGENSGVSGRAIVLAILVGVCAIAAITVSWDRSRTKVGAFYDLTTRLGGIAPVGLATKGATDHYRFAFKGPEIFAVRRMTAHGGPLPLFATGDPWDWFLHPEVVCLDCTRPEIYGAVTTYTDGAVTRVDFSDINGDLVQYYTVEKHGETYRLAHSKPSADRGIDLEEHTYDRFERLTESTFDGGGVRYIRDETGRVSEEIVRGRDETRRKMIYGDDRHPARPTEVTHMMRPESHGCTVVQTDWDSIGHPVHIRCLNAARAPIVTPAGCASFEIFWDAQNWTTSCLDLEGEPTKSLDGWTHLRVRTDPMAYPYIVAWLDADGHEVANPTGASMVRIERDERGQVLAYTRYAPDGRTL